MRATASTTFPEFEYYLSCQHAQVNDAKNQDPYDINEVPVVANRAEGIGSLRSENSALSEQEHHGEHHQAGKYVQAVEAGEREEGRTEQRAADGQTAANQAGV